MIIAHLTFSHYKMNIVYEDYDGIKVKCIISTNLHDFYEHHEDIEKIKKIFTMMIKQYFTREYTQARWKVPEYIQHTIMHSINSIK